MHQIKFIVTDSLKRTVGRGLLNSFIWLALATNTSRSETAIVLTLIPNNSYGS